MPYLKTFGAVNVGDGILNFIGINGAVIKLLGCSTETSVQPLEKVNSFLITNFHDQGDLIAVTVDGGRDSALPFLIEIEKRDGKSFIDLDRPESNKAWIPRADRMIQLFKNGCMRLKVGDEWFSTDFCDHAKGHRTLPPSAGNLMVKYAYGLAEAEEIIDLAEEIQLQADAVEMLEIQAGKNALLNRQLREQENQICTLTNNLNSVLFSTGGTIYRMKEIERSVGDINSELEKTFSGKKSIRQSLSNISTLVTEVKKILTEKP